MNNKQKIITISASVLVVVIIVAGYFYWSGRRPSKEAANALQKANNALEQAAKDATKGTLPSLSANPMENKPDLNPVNKANPIKDIKINPFE